MMEIEEIGNVLLYNNCVYIHIGWEIPGILRGILFCNNGIWRAM